MTTSKPTSQTGNGRIVAWTPPNQAPEYYLRGCGPLRPLTIEEARRLRQDGVPAELPVTAPLGDVPGGSKC